MKRRKAAAVSAFILMGVLLAGCSAHTAAVDKDSADEPEKTKLQIAIFEGGYGREYWDAVCEAFEKENPDIDIVMQSNAEIGDIIRPTIIAGNPPDFVYLPSNNISGVTSALIKDHALADITDVMEEVEDKLIPGFLDTKSCQPYDDGKIYLAPMYYSPMGMWYNKDYFEKNSLEVPETWDEFFALGNDERCADRALFAYQGIYPAYMESVILSSIVSSAGTEAMDACLNYEEGAWRNEKVREVLDSIAKIGTEGYLLEGAIFMDHTQAQAEWLEGEAMFIPAGSWIENEMVRATRENGFSFGFAAAPALEQDDERYVYTRIEEMYIPAAAENIEAAKEFLAFQYSDTAIELNAKLAKGVPPVVGAAEKIKDYASEAVYESYRIFEQGYKPYMGEFAAVTGSNIVPRDSFYAQVGEVMSGMKTVDEWIEEMEAIGDQVRDSKVQ